MPTLSITWHIKDDSACPICKELNNFTWEFVAGKDAMTDALWHPAKGIVWSLSAGSEAHGGYHKGKRNCRCHITHKINCEDVLAKCVYLREVIRDALAESEESELSDVKKGSYRTTTLEDLGITL